MSTHTKGSGNSFHDAHQQLLDESAAAAAGGDRRRWLSTSSTLDFGSLHSNRATASRSASAGRWYSPVCLPPIACLAGGRRSRLCSPEAAAAAARPTARGHRAPTRKEANTSATTTTRPDSHRQLCRRHVRATCLLTESSSPVSYAKLTDQHSARSGGGRGLAHRVQTTGMAAVCMQMRSRARTWRLEMDFD